MKKHLHNSLRALFLSLAVLLSLPMLAVKVTIDGIRYDLVAETKQATVIENGKYSSEVVIPESVEHEGATYSVTSIGYEAFRNCSGLTSVTIPNSVTSIGRQAFDGCSSLTSVHISDIAAWCNIEFDIYNSYGHTYNSNPLYYAHHLYLNGEKVKDLVIPNSVTSIKDYAFYSCSDLTSVTIPNSVTSIGEDAFYECSGLTSVHISDIAAWCNIDFADSYSNPLYYAYHLYLNGEEVKDLVIPNSVTSIGEWAFGFCSGLTSVTIPNSVISIGDDAFNNCSGLTSVTIPNSVTSIGRYAFGSCSGLTSVTIGNSVTSIGEFAFYRCSALTSVTIPNSVTSIGSWAFYGCSGLTSVHISDIAAWCNIDFKDDNSSNPLYYAYHLYLNGEEVKDLVIPNSVTSIRNHAFRNCDGLTSVTIPNSVTSIGKYAFSGCNFARANFVNNSSFSAEDNNYWGANIVDYETQDGLLIESTSVVSCRKSAVIVTIPNSVTSIGDYAFRNCSGLTSVIIPNSVTSIGREAFSGCSGLTSVTIPNSVTSIWNEAFKDCMLQTIVCKAIKPAVMSGSLVFSTNMFNHTQLYVPEGAYWDYAFSDWGSFIRIKEMAMDTEGLESKKVYMIADASGRNYSVYDSAKGDLVNITYTHALDEESEGSCWTVLKEANASYLYNIGAKRYGTIAEDGALTLSDAPVGVDIVSTGEGLSINGKPCMFVLNNNISFDATGIDELKGENGTENSAIYDLSGRRVQKGQKGVFIRDGKVVIK